MRHETQNVVFRNTMAFRVDQLRKLIREALGNAYKILGVSPSASQDEIKSAFRRLIAAKHPDKHPGDQKAADEFKKISAAWNQIGDADKRKTYNLKGDRFVDDTGPVTTPSGSPSAKKPDTGEAWRPKQNPFDAERERARRYRERQEADDAERARARANQRSQQAPPPRPGILQKRTFVNYTGTSRKFWSVEPRLPNPTVIEAERYYARVTWGRIGTLGQAQTKSFPSRESMMTWIQTMISSKLAKGYAERNAQQAPPPPPKPSERAAAGNTHNKPKPEPKTTTAKPGKTGEYRIYGKKGSAPVHTRFGGKVYVPHKTSRFKNGDRAKVGLGSDGRLSVNRPSDNWTQVWDASNESVNIMIDELVAQYLVEIVTRIL